MRSRLSPYLILSGLGLLFFADLVLHPTQVLYSDHSDLIAEHLPAKRFLIESWQRTGEIPRWCPYIYAGVPFIHDIQVGIFYPLYWPLFLLPSEAIAPVLSWLIVLHVIAAGWFMFLYGRSQGLDQAGALVAAVGFMFAGKWMFHLLGAGHTITIGLAWLPLVLLGLEQAQRRRRLLWATGAGVAFALLILGTHPQWTFYAGLFVAVWTLGPALEEAGYLGGTGQRSLQRTAKELARWLGLGIWTAFVASALCAVQLLPTSEAAAESNRMVGVGPGHIISEGLQALIGLVRPSLLDWPPERMWETQAGQSFWWLVAAALAPLLGRSRVRFQAGVCLGLLVFAFGGAALLQWLPGFRVFRQPTRMLVVAALPVAYLAGFTTQALFAGSGATDEVRQQGRRIVTRLLIAVVILSGGFALRLAFLEQRPLRYDLTLLYWISLLVTVPAGFWLLRGLPPAWRRREPIIWIAILFVDLWAMTWPLVAVRPESSFYSVPDFLHSLTEPGRVLDRDTAELRAAPLGRGAPLAMLHRIEALRGYTPLDVLRYKEYLQMIGDSDQPLRPFESRLTFPVIEDFPLVNQSLLDLLGTRYLVQPRRPAALDSVSLLALDPTAGFPAALPWAALYLGSSTGEIPPSERLLLELGWRRWATEDHPVVYDFFLGGMRDLGPVTVFENDHVLPRAFVVPEAEPLPELSQILSALKTADFRKKVFLEHWQSQPGTHQALSAFRRAEVLDDQPNRVVVQVNGETPGFLVLTDIWFPGWKAYLDGEPVPVYRANYLFRAVAVPAGTHTIVFSFEPRSFHWGKVISGAALLVVGGLLLLTVIRSRMAAG